MKYFVITKGGVARVMQADDSVTDPMDEVAKWHPADRAQVTSARPISRAEIPDEKRLRDAWVDTGSKIVVDLAKARQCARKCLEAAESPVDETALATADLEDLKEMLP